MQRMESDVWIPRVRALFWIVGLTVGAVLAYTTRYYLNADGINYIEMGDSLRDGNWYGLVNLTESPGYAFVLGLGHLLLSTTVVDELPLLKIVNWVCLAVAMAACDLFVTGLRTDVERLGTDQERPLPFLAVSALSYALFLYLALGWVRVRLVAPDMVVFALSLVTMWLILRIRRNPDSYPAFLWLGISTGLSFLFKTFFFPFSGFIFALAALVTGSVRKAIPRIALAVAAMLLVAAPLLIPLSREVGRFSYGEVGNYGYVYQLAGQGEPLHGPERLNTNPTVDLFRSGPGKTFPSGYDLAYWTLGMKPAFTAGMQMKHLIANTYEMLSFAYGLIVVAIGWLLFQRKIGRLEWGSLWPPSLLFVLTFLSIPGMGVYCLMHVEPRYLVGFFFFPFVAVTLLPRYNPQDAQTRKKILVSVGLVTLFLMAGVVETSVDQSLRGLHTAGQKLSHREAYGELLAVNAFMDKHGIKAGDETAVVGTDQLPPTYWARMAGIRITGAIPGEQEFVTSSPQDRQQALTSLRDRGIKAVVAKGAYIAPLVSEGWRLIPDTRDYYALVF